VWCCLIDGRSASVVSGSSPMPSGTPAPAIASASASTKAARRSSLVGSRDSMRRNDARGPTRYFAWLQFAACPQVLRQSGRMLVTRCLVSHSCRATGLVSSYWACENAGLCPLYIPRHPHPLGGGRTHAAPLHFDARSMQVDPNFNPGASSKHDRVE